jgi:hypothetical protein
VTGLQRHKPMKRSKLLARTALSRGKPLARKTPVKPRNAKRKAEQFARNFGDEAEAVRALPCLCRGIGPVVRCVGPVQAAHVTARGMGAVKGGRFDLVPLCAHHHGEAGEANRPGENVATARDLFERAYGLDLRAAADRVALEHAAPLGIRGLAERWVIRCGCGHEWRSRPDGCDCIAPKTTPLDTYELAALLGWVRRAMQAEHDRRRAQVCDGPRWAVYIGDLLGIRSDDNTGERAAGAWSLCELAGWPS